MTKPHICVCICTFKRPEQLARLLSRLREQVTEELFDYSIVVADNDLLESGRPVVESFSVESRIPITYAVEPRQNIALARNKTVENTTGDFIAFIDDDEFPLDHWLVTLYRTMQCFEQDGVLGPVFPYFETEPPQWVLKGKLFERPGHQTGSILEPQNTRTGNVLMKRELFKDRNTWFNPAFGKGGEDQDFFDRKIQAGHTFLWCNEAPVFERIPPERWQRKTLLNRALVRGQMAVRATKSQPRSFLRATVAVALYSSLLMFFLAFGHHYFMKYLIKICDHLGLVLTVLGINCVEEKQIDFPGGTHSNE